MIYTVGHSTHSAKKFLDLLNAHGIRQVADIRTIPRSRRHPHFSIEALNAFLVANAIVYRHFAALGGLRKPRRDSVNTVWRHEGFRGYADYMQTDDFSAALDELVSFAASAPTAAMCAEAAWWQCHRRLLSDALLVRGVPVRHIMSEAEPKPHELSEFARANNGKVIYSGVL